MGEGEEIEDEMIKLGVEKGLIEIRDDRIKYLPLGKSYDFTHLEEPVRARAYVKLIINHEYPADRIDVEVQLPVRPPERFADIVVYEDREKEHPYIVAEAKASSANSDIEVAEREGLGNANLLPPAKYLYLICEKYEAVYDISERPSLSTLERYRIPTLPKRYGKPPRYKFIKGEGVFDLRKAMLDELMGKFRNCHDYIWEGGKEIQQ